MTDKKTFAHVREKEIIGPDGNPLLLRSMGLGNWLLPEGYMWKFGKKGDRPRRIERMFSDLVGQERAEEFWIKFRDTYITEQDIRRISELGFNSVRPALNARLLMDERTGELIEQGFHYIDRLLSWCTEYSIYVILDLHGAPGGQTGTNIDDSISDRPELFTNSLWQERTIQLWKSIAKRYKDSPIVIAYDLLNEPLPKGESERYWKDLEPLYKRITTAIRTVDQDHMICLEGANWASDWSVFSKPFDDNTFYQFHKYWNDNTDYSLRQYTSFRDKYHIPIWAGETGENTNNWYAENFELLEKNNIGWSFWPWKKLHTTNTPYSIKTPENWDLISAYSRDEGPAPDPESSWMILSRFLNNILLSNCEYYPEVVDSVFRRSARKNTDQSVTRQTG